MVLPVTLPWYAYYVYKHPIQKKDLLPLTLYSLMATTIYLSLVFWGFNQTTAIDGNLLGTLNPILIIFLGAVMLKEQITSREKTGIVIVLIGALITIIQPLIEEKTFALENVFGNILLLTASVVWAIFVVFSKKNSRHFSPVLITLHGSIVAVITCFVLAYFENSMHIPDIRQLVYDPSAFWGVFYMAYVAYILSYILYEYGMNKIEISEGSLFTYLQPLVATPLAAIFLGEHISLSFLLGAVVIFAGVVLSEWK